MENLYFCASGPCPGLGTCLPHCLALAVLGIVLLVAGVVPSSPHPQPWGLDPGSCDLQSNCAFYFYYFKK